jgi:hypothetical protein
VGCLVIGDVLHPVFLPVLERYLEGIRINISYLYPFFVYRNDIAYLQVCSVKKLGAFSRPLHFFSESFGLHFLLLHLRALGFHLFAHRAPAFYRFIYRIPKAGYGAIAKTFRRGYAGHIIRRVAAA